MSDNLPALIDYSKALSASDLLPDAYRGKPANVLVAMEYGQALGLAPMAAIQGITVIKGKPTASASLMAGLVRRAGHILRVSGDDKRAECTIIRSDDPDFEFKTVWTIDRAQKAGLTSNQTWAKYPDAMLKARAISECARNACSEILAGVQYTSEELGEVDTPAPTTAKRTSAVRQRGVTSTVPTAEPVVVNEPDLDDVVDAEIVEEPTALPLPSASKGQITRINILLKGTGVNDREVKLQRIADIIGRPIASSNDLTANEAHLLIDTLEELIPTDTPELDD